MKTHRFRAQFVLGQNILYIGFGMDHPAGGLGMNDDASEAGEGNAGPPSIIGVSDENSHAWRLVRH